MSENIIKKIELDIDGVGISLTPEQAKRLHVALGELFGEKVVKEFISYPVPYTPKPYRWYPSWEPTWTYTSPVYTTMAGITANYCADNGALQLTG